MGSSKPVHLWAPSVVREEGGIQTFSHFLLRSLAAEAGEVRGFAVNDAVGPVDVGGGATRISVGGFGKLPGRLRNSAFAAWVALAAAADHPRFIISTHLAFGPVARGLRKVHGIPYVLVLHGIEAWGLEEKSKVRALAEAELLLPVSRFTRDLVMREQGLPEERFVVFPNTFDEGAYTLGERREDLLARHGIASGSRVILTVGRLDPDERYKGHDQVIRALPEVRRALGDTPVHYLIGGEGGDRGRLEEIAYEVGVAGSVVFAGRLTSEELPDYYRSCDCFAMPSTGEGFGIVFLEAMGCGCPVLAGNRDGSTDALNGGELGILVDPGDPVAIARQLAELLLGNHPNRLLYEPEALRRRAVELFGKAAFRGRVGELLRRFTD